MNNFLHFIYLFGVAGVVMAGTFAICRSQQACLGSSLREALALGGCLILSATVNCFLIAPGYEYFMAAS